MPRGSTELPQVTCSIGIPPSLAHSYCQVWKVWFEKWFQRPPTKTNEDELSFKDIFREAFTFPSQFYSVVIIGDEATGKSRFVSQLLLTVD